MSERTLSACPSSPNCVSTQANDEAHAIAPFRYKKSRVEAKEALKAVIASLPRATLIEEDEAYLRYEFTSLLLRCVDDIEVVLDETTKTIQFRSASRTGYSDLGVNRRRMEQVRTLLSAKLYPALFLNASAALADSSFVSSTYSVKYALVSRVAITPPFDSARGP